MKYNIIHIEKPGMVQNWDELELPDNTIPLHIELWKNKCENHHKIYDIKDIFNEDDCKYYKYDKNTGQLIRSRKDRDGFEEFKIFTKIYCLIQKPESEEERHTRTAENSSKIAKMIEEIKMRKVAAVLMDNKEKIELTESERREALRNLKVGLTIIEKENDDA